MTAVMAVPQPQYLILRTLAEPSIAHKESEDGVQKIYARLDCFDIAGCLVQRQSPV